MHKNLIIAALIASTPVFAANFGSSPAPAATGAAATPSAGQSVPATVLAPAASLLPAYPQVADAFRIVKPDGATVIQQGTLTASVPNIQVINVTDKDAFATSGGKCAFNVKYDEISGVAATGTVNRIYANDALIAQNSAIDLQAGVLKTIWTQPYLVPGLNSIKIVVNVNGAAPSTKWIRVNVSGTCGAAASVPKSPQAATYVPGSNEWTNLVTVQAKVAYAVTVLNGKGFVRYADIVNLNNLMLSAINSKVISQALYTGYIGYWNTMVTYPPFIAAMTAASATSSKQ